VFAEALLQADDVDRAERMVWEALEVIGTSRNRLFEAEAHRLAGACLAARGGDAAAEAASKLLHAIQIADRQGAIAFRLRAATTLARLWRNQNCKNQARDLLRSIYDQFTEGFTTADIQDAKAILDDLEAS